MSQFPLHVKEPQSKLEKLQLRFAEDAVRWRAVQARDREADGAFFYSVKSTGVFCRPSCPARQARRENVAFHTTAAEAEAAGFRACLRCRPLASVDLDASARKMIELSGYIRAHAGETLSLQRLAAIADLSPYHLQRSFKATLGVTPKQFQSALRLERLKSRLRTDDSVAGAIFDSGFGSTSRVYELVDGRLGMTPSSYRAGGAGETIHYAFRRTAFGLLMMAATDRGVCAVRFGDHEAALIQELEAEYPRAALTPVPAEAEPLLEAWIAALDAHLSEGGPRPDLPLDLRGTAFQIRVWEFLLKIREGEVVSYAELAAGIDAPKAVRAAASACAANRIAVLVPCHRVLRGDGSLGGYRWGMERKRALIEAERRRSRGVADSGSGSE